MQKTCYSKFILVHKKKLSNEKNVAKKIFCSMKKSYSSVNKKLNTIETNGIHRPEEKDFKTWSVSKMTCLRPKQQYKKLVGLGNSRGKQIYDKIRK